MLQTEIFGAFLTACRARKVEEGFSRVELARRMGKDKSVITRLLKGHSNMKVETIAEFANAVEADIGFYLVDRKNRYRVFTGHGVEQDEGSLALMFPAQTGGARPTVALHDLSASLRPLTATPQFWDLLVSKIQAVAVKG